MSLVIEALIQLIVYIAECLISLYLLLSVSCFVMCLLANGTLAHLFGCSFAFFYWSQSLGAFGWSLALPYDVIYLIALICWVILFMDQKSVYGWPSTVHFIGIFGVERIVEFSEMVPPILTAFWN